MGFRKVKIVFSKRKDKAEHVEALLDALDDVSTMTFVDKIDNGVVYIFERGRIQFIKISEVLQKAKFKVINADDIEGTATTVFIIAPSVKTFDELDDERLSTLWD